MYCFIQNVLFYTKCIVLDPIKCWKCIDLAHNTTCGEPQLEDVLVSQTDPEQYEVYCFIQNVLFYTKCIVLYKMYCFRPHKVLEMY